MSCETIGSQGTQLEVWSQLCGPVGVDRLLVASYPGRSHVFNVTGEPGDEARLLDRDSLTISIFLLFSFRPLSVEKS